MYKFGVDVGGTTVKIGLFSGDGKLEEKYEDCDVQFYKGDQPLYYFIMAVE